MKADVPLGLEDDNFAAGERERTRYPQPYHSRADDGDVGKLGHEGTPLWLLRLALGVPRGSRCVQASSLCGNGEITPGFY